MSDLSNIIHPHDPHWRERFLSVTAAAEGRGAWFVVRFLFVVSYGFWLGVCFRYLG